jgi:O-antigen/teichoic acid export membrane protein/glycosyltransferase involved in cell wall biosynthesis
VEGKNTSHWPITLTNGVAAIFNLFLPLVLVRILSPEEVGRYKIFFLYVMLSPGLFLVTGLSNGLYHWAGQYPKTKPEVRQSWTLLLLITGLLTALGWVFSAWAAPLIQVSVTDLHALLISVPLIIVSAFLEDLLIARGNIWTGSLYASGFNVFRALSIVAVAWWSRRVDWVIYVFAAGVGIRALVGWLLLLRTGEINLSFSWDRSKKVLRYALPVSVAAMAALALQNIDQMILSFRLAPAEFAIYAMGCLSIPPLHIFEISVNRVLIPRLSRAFAEGSPSRAALLFGEGVLELFRFLLPAAIGLIIFAQPIVHILFTERYEGAAAFLRFYALSYLFLALPFDAVARARADGAWILRTYIVFALLSIGATWIAAGKWHAMGALLAVLSCQLLMRLYTLAYVRRSLETPLGQFFPVRPMAVQIGLVLIATLFSLGLRPFFSDPRTWFIVTGPLFAVIYLGGTYAAYLREHIRSPGPIHVLEVAQSVSLGGLERMIYCLAQQLHQSPRFEVLVATYDHASDQPTLVPHFEEAGIRVIQWKKRKGFSLFSVFRLVRLILAEQTRILHVHNLGPLIYGTLAKAFSFGHVKLVLTLHSLTDLQQSSRYQFYFKCFLRYADRIIAVSPFIQARLVALGVQSQRIEVIPNGVFFSDASRINGDPGKKRALRKQLFPNLEPHFYSSRWMLCLARLHPGKGQEVVLEMWSALPKEARAQLVLFFVGQETHAGHRDWLLKKVLAAPDANRIVIAGPSNQPQQWIEASDIFVSGSQHEGMPLAPLEAVGSGLPSILSDIEGHHFLKSWAYYFDPRNPGEGARQIVDILKALERDDLGRSFQERWQAASSLRQTWGAPAMTASYAAAFETTW